MREIKLRAFHIGQERFLDLENEYILSLDSMEHDIFRIWERDSNGKNSGVLFANDKHCELNMFTGLKDKNGKEIYEGDILKYEYFYNPNRTKSADGLIKKTEYIEVKMCNNEMFYGWNVNIHTLSIIEVIGNIYENPELTK